VWYRVAEWVKAPNRKGSFREGCYVRGTGSTTETWQLKSIIRHNCINVDAA